MENNWINGGATTSACFHIAGVTCSNCAPRRTSSVCPHCTPRCPHGYPADGYAPTFAPFSAPLNPWPYSPSYPTYTWTYDGAPYNSTGMRFRGGNQQ